MAENSGQLPAVSQALSDMNITTFMEDFKTKRVQVYVPQLFIKSQVS